MIDFGQVGRLLRQDWDSPTDLAREIYQMVTSKEARRPANPVSIEIPQSQAGIVISRQNAPAGPSPFAANSTTHRTVRTNVPNTVKPDALRTDVPNAREIGQHSDSSFARPPSSGDQSSFEAVDDSRPDSGNFPKSPGLQNQSPNRNLRGPQVQSGPDFAPSRAEATGSVGARRGGYQQPVFGTNGEVRFAGNAPVQFDAPPRVWNPRTDQYEQYSFDGELTRIPLDTDDGDDTSWGQVISGAGATYQMNLFPDPDPDTQASATEEVTIVGLDPSEVLPPGTWVYPVTAGGPDGDKYYGMVPMWL